MLASRASCSSPGPQTTSVGTREVTVDAKLTRQTATTFNVAGYLPATRAVGVDSIDDTIAAIEANGGKIVMPKFHIPTVGTLIFFEDTEGNVIGAMQLFVGIGIDLHGVRRTVLTGFPLAIAGAALALVSLAVTTAAQRRIVRRWGRRCWCSCRCGPGPRSSSRCSS